MNTIKIIVVDDLKGFRESVKTLFSKVNNVEVSNEFGTPQDLLLYLEKPDSEKPDFILLDNDFNYITPETVDETKKDWGFNHLPLLTEKYPSIKCLIVSFHNDKPYLVKEAFKKGASGYISKHDDYRFDLKKAIRSLSEDPAFFYRSPDIPARWVNEALQELRNFESPIRDQLTGTEFKVFLGIAVGKTKPMIIEERTCAEGAFDHHTRRIRIKLGFECNWEIPVMAIEKRVPEVLEFYREKGIHIT
ncbi:MAG: response regulator [Bacteroidota bacterium]